MAMLVVIMQYVIVLCWPAGWLVKCHTKRHFKFQDNAAGHTTFFDTANMLARLVLVANRMQICPVFY